MNEEKTESKPDSQAKADSSRSACSVVVSDTPETDQAWKTSGNSNRQGWELARKFERKHKECNEGARIIDRERIELRQALRDMIAAKGRYNTQKAMERLILLLPENQ